MRVCPAPFLICILVDQKYSPALAKADSRLPLDTDDWRGGVHGPGGWQGEGGGDRPGNSKIRSDGYLMIDDVNHHQLESLNYLSIFFPRWAPSKSSSSWTEPTPSPSSSATSFRLVCVWICKQADIIPSTTQNLMKKLVFFFDQRLYIITCKYPPIRNKNLFCDNKLEMLK